MAGYFQLPQRVSADGRPYPGAKAYFYEASTLTPLTVYRDYSLGSAHPNPLTADTDGVFEPVFLDEADEFYRYRLTTASGVVLQDIVTLPIIGPTEGEGGGGEVAVDPDAVLKTGDTKWRLGTGTHSGFVRVNGRTIGSATSGATERANADTQALYEHVWTNFSNDLCAVAGGRGGSAAADFAANKAIALPDARGRVLAGLDDMGNSAASRLTSTTITGGATTLGLSGGAQTHTLASGEMPSHTHTFTGSALAAHGHPFRISEVNSEESNPPGGFMLSTSSDSNQTAFTGTPTETAGQQIGGASAGTPAGTNSNTGGGSAHNNLQPTLLCTLYCKL